MAGKDNLRDIRTRTKEEARKIGQKGGIASGEARRQRKTYRHIVQQVSEMGAPDKLIKMLERQGISKEDATYQTAVVLKMFDEAMNGSVSAFNALVKIAGEAIDKHEVTSKESQPRQPLSMKEIREQLKEWEESQI